MKKFKFSLIIFIIILITTICMHINKVAAIKFDASHGGYNSWRSIENDEHYYQIMYYAGSHNNKPISYKESKEDTFFNYYKDNNFKWNGLERKTMNGNNGVNAGTDYVVAMNGSWRLACVYHQSGGGNTQPINLNYILKINANGNNPFEIEAIISKNPDKSKANNINSETKKYSNPDELAMWSYVMATDERWSVENYVYSYGRNLNKEIKVILQKSFGKDFEFDQVIQNSNENGNVTENAYIEYLNENKGSFGSNITGTTKGTVKEGNYEITTTKGGKWATKYKIGPFKLDYVYGDNEFKNQTKINLTRSGKDKTFSVCYGTSTQAVDKSEIVPNKNFYIYTNATPDSNMKINFYNNYVTYGALMYFFSAPNVVQNRCIYKPFISTSTQSTELTFGNEVKPITIYFYKQGKNNKGLSDAKIQYVGLTNATLIKNNLIESNSKGKLGYIQIQPEKNKNCVLTIKETATQENYLLENSDVQITIKHDNNGNITSMSRSGTNSNPTINCSRDDEDGIVKILNKEVLQDFDLSKVDFAGTLYKDVPFDITIHGVEAIFINKKIYRIGNTKITNIQGLDSTYAQYKLTTSEIKIWADKDTTIKKVGDTIKITNIKTSNKGRIEFSVIPKNYKNLKNDATIIYDITERELSENRAIVHREKSSGELYTYIVKYKYNSTKNAWENNTIISKTDEPYLSVDGSTMTITVKDDLVFKYLTIAKNVKDAIFKVTLENVSKVRIPKGYLTNETPDIDKSQGSKYEWKKLSDGSGLWEITAGNDNKITINNLKTIEHNQLAEKDENENIIPANVITFHRIVLKKSKTLHMIIEEIKSGLGTKKIESKIYATFEKQRTGFRVKEVKKVSSSGKTTKLVVYDEKQGDIIETKDSTGEFVGVFNYENKEVKDSKGRTRKIMTELPLASNNICLIKLNDPEIADVDLNIHKKDDNGNALAGATFTAKYYQQNEKGKYPTDPFKTLTATSATSTGIADFGEVIPPTTKNIKIVVEETVSPPGFAGLYGDIELEFSYNKAKDRWDLKAQPKNSAVSNVKVTSTNTEAPKHNTTTIEFDVKNTPTIGNFTIFKEDMAGQRISDIGFSVYLNNIKSVKVENKEILLTDIEKGKTIDIGNGITIERIVEESTGDSNRITIHGLKTDSEGKITIPEIVPSEKAKVIFVTVTEESGKAGFVTLPKELRLLLLRDEKTNQWKLYERKPGKIPTGYSSKYTELQNKLPDKYWSLSDDNEVTVTLKNDSKIDKLVINKVDQQNNSKKVKGAKFRVTTTNIKSINGKDGVTTVDVETNDDGNFTLENLVIEDVTKDITLTIKETAAPTGYKLIQGEIVVTLHRQGEKYTISETTVVGNVDEKEFTPGAVTLDNHVLNLNIKDIPIMQMGGKVWLDGQTGIKPEYPANGKLDNGEIGVENVKVALYKGNELIVKDVYGNELSTATDENGNYLFSNIEKGTNYRIEFTYDGIKFERTIAGDSKAEEKDRPGFNNKFETINVGETGTGIHLDYATEGNKSRLISSDSQLIQRDGNNKITKLNMGNVRENFKIHAQSGNYLNNENDWLESWKEVTSCEARNINLGLVERGVDLSLVADVASARVTINGKEKEYPYSEISNNLINIKPEEIGETTSSEETEYVLDLPEADYNFRLGDYLAENYLKFDYMDKTNYIKELRENSAELKIYVTYKIHLNNQSTNIAKVNSIVDYYSENYTYLDNSAKYVKYDGSTEKEISGAQISVKIDNGTQTIGDNTYKKMEIEINDTSNDSKLTDGGRNILYLTFEVNGTGPDIEANINGEGEIRYGNIAEITSYSTEEGYVDVDSAPGNAIQDGDLRLEDDTDKAPLLNINVESSKIRKTDGLVWEDENVNGKREDSEKLVNNVIVQLVELKTLIVNNQTFNIEYVWQEMLSGSGSLLRANYNTEKNGIVPVEENVTQSDGSYTFQNYIPGNYVIRFIYGDGTTATYGMDGKMIKYNGQDYKSTIDNAYNQEVFNENNYGTDKTESIARDNESRRLNVMSYSVDVDSKKGMLLKLLNVDDNYEPYYKKLNDDYYSDTEKKILAEICGCDVASLTTDMLKGKLHNVLKETYMYADTSRIEVPVDDNDISSDQFDKYENMNFGLTERPKNKLTLEKHVTGLQVQVNSKDIANATADNAGTAADPIEKLKGTRKGLTAFRATRENRGAWKLETDIEELLQGATIKVEYTYTVTQEGETDYLSEQLQNDYKTFSVEDYTEKLKDYANKNKPNGTYLTPGYYLGNSATPISLSRVEKVEDYYEHITDTNKSEETEDLKFVEGDTEGFVSIDSPEKTKKKAYILKTDGNSADELFTMNKTVTNEKPFDLLEKIENDKHPYSTKVANTSKVLSSFNQDAELSFKSYIAQITEYSTATGRRDLSSTPGNLNYIYYQSESLNTMNNEDDEFWAEDVTITKPTGEDKTSMTTIIIIAASSLATLVVAIILIKKFIIGKTPKQ